MTPSKNCFTIFLRNITICVFGIAWIYRESQKHETWKTTWGLLICILIRMIGLSIETNMRKVSVMLNEFYSNLSYLQERILLSKEIGMSYVFWDSLYLELI